MGSFKFAWICSLLSLCLLTGTVFWLDSDPALLQVLGRPLTLVAAIWLVGMASTALIILYERAARRRLVKRERRSAEREATLRTAEAAAHELAQPLTVVMAYAQWLRRGSASPGDSRYYLEQMVGSCHEMSVILRNFYETIRHSRAQTGLTILDEPLPLREGDGVGETEDELEPERLNHPGSEYRSRPWRRGRTSALLG